MTGSEKTPVSSARIAVIIPTYNNERTIATVVDHVRAHVADAIVVNDGSTDRTGEVLRALAGIDLVELPHNRGKGAALQAAFRRALDRGFTHAITIDADGGHLAIDLPTFVGKVNESPQTLWIGNRCLPAGARLPLRSRWNRAVGAFWYRFFTGVEIADTQCGFRAYPLGPIVAIGCTTARYEYELEVLTKAAWNGIAVRPVSVHLFGQLREETVSHFRPVRDSLRISRVNAGLALTRVFFPFRTMDVPGRTAWDKIRLLVQRELKTHTTPMRAALSLGIGVCFGILPIYGFQVIALLFLSFVVKINRPLAFLGVNVSPPPVLPFLIAGGFVIGKAVLPDQFLTSATATVLTRLLQGGIEWLVGSCILAVAAGALTFLVAWMLLSWRIKMRQ